MSITSSSATTITPVAPKQTKAVKPDSKYSQSLKSVSRNSQEYRDKKIMYSRNEPAPQVDDLLTQVKICYHL